MAPEASPPKERLAAEPATALFCSLHPSIPIDTRIAIVGGGPSGLTAAWALERLGFHHVTVLEKQPIVGGMCESLHFGGRTYDLGGQVLAQGRAPTMAALAAELGVQMEALSAGDHRQWMVQVTAGGASQELDVFKDFSQVIPLTAQLQAEAEKTERIGIHGVADLASEPAEQFLRCRGHSKGLPASIAAIFTSSGYGYPADIPYAYMHEFNRTSVLGEIQRVRGGYCSLWQKLAASLSDVRCSSRVIDIRRPDSGPITIRVAHHSGESQLEFDKLIVTGALPFCNNPTYRSFPHPGCEVQPAPPADQATLPFKWTPPEARLFSKVQTMEYYTTVLEIEGLERFPAGFFYFKEYIEDPNTIGYPLAMQRFFPDTNVFLFWSYGNAQVQHHQVTSCIYELVDRIGGCGSQLITQRKWNYFPHVESQDIKAGFYDEFSKLQGQNGTYYVGGLLAFEHTERNATFSMNLVAKHFGSTHLLQPYVKRLFQVPFNEREYGPTSALPGYDVEELSEAPGMCFPDLPTVDAYLQFYANHQVTKDKVLYTWLDDQGKESDKRTYADLNLRASVITHRLLTSNAKLKRGDRVLLLHPPGLEFVEAFFGCLRAQVFPVPLIPPDPGVYSQALLKVQNVAKSSAARAILATSWYHLAVTAATLKTRLVAEKSGNRPQWPDLPWYHTDLWTGKKKQFIPDWTRWLSPREHDIDTFGIETNKHECSRPPDAHSQADNVCFLQFTSGSTGDSKGVMITHNGLIHNVKLMRRMFKSTSRTVLVSWLPQYHDMGLIGGLLTSLVSGGTAILFSPVTFIKRPLLWMEAISRYRGTHTAGPNFAYELIARRMDVLHESGRHVPAFNLSSVRFLMNTSEPIRHQTMARFLELFRTSGLQEQIMAPGYGLAENSVFACTAYGMKRPIYLDWENRVCCGYVERGNGHVDIKIVDPESGQELENGKEGEIWVSSPSVGIGYWGLLELSRETFHNQLGDSGRRFLRTGDLGRVIGDMLFVTGRIKDLIIVAGRNIYPSDVEKTVEGCSRSIRPGCSAAFGVPVSELRLRTTVRPGAAPQASAPDDVGIVVVAEVRDEKASRLDPELVGRIKADVASEHGVEVAHVVLVKPRTIPKTTSGKIRRRECSKRFLDGTLVIVKPAGKLMLGRSVQRCGLPDTARTKTAQEIGDHLVKLVAERMGLGTDQISTTEALTSFGMDSVAVVWAAQKLSEFLGIHIAAIDVYTAGSIAELTSVALQLVHKAAPGSTTTGAETLRLGSENCQECATSLAAEMEKELISDAQLESAVEPSQRRKLVITCLQMLGLLYMAAVIIFPAFFVYGKVGNLVISDVQGPISSCTLAVKCALLVPLGWLGYLALTAVSIFATTLLRPNYCIKTAVPLWSLDYVNWWMLYRLCDFASNYVVGIHLRGTVFLTYWYRLLGAEIGNHVFLDTTDITDPSLLYVGSGAVLSEGATIQSHDVRGGVVRFQPIRIGRGTVVEPYAVVQQGTILDAGARVPALARTEIGEKVGTKHQGGSDHLTQEGQEIWGSTTATALAAQQLCGLYIVGLVTTVSAMLSYIFLLWFNSKLSILHKGPAEQYATMARIGFLCFPVAATLPWALMGLAPLLAFHQPELIFSFLCRFANIKDALVLLAFSGAAYLTFAFTLSVITCALKWQLIGDALTERLCKDDALPLNSRLGFNVWLIHRMLTATHMKVTMFLSGTDTLVAYLRSLGATIGNMASIRSVNPLLDPDLLTLGDESHLGDFAKIITSTVTRMVLKQGQHKHHLHFGKVDVRSRCIVGAQSVLMPGVKLEDEAILGANSVAVTGSFLQKGGVYVGVKSPVMIYQQGEVAKISPESEKQQEREYYRIEEMDPLYRKLVANLAASIAKTTLSLNARYFHRLGVAGKGTLSISESLGDTLPAHDVFAPGKTYTILVRHSNGLSGDDDARGDARGASVRILRPGAESDAEQSLLDLTLKSGRAFHCSNMSDFVSYFMKGHDERVLFVQRNPRSGVASWETLRLPNSYAELHYYSNVARLFRSLGGVPQEYYVKFRMRPSDESFGEDEGKVEPFDIIPPDTGTVPRDPTDTRPPQFLAAEFRSRVLSSGGVKYIFQLQLRPVSQETSQNEDALDCSKPWDEAVYPYRDVGLVHLDEVLDKEVTERLRFNPSNGPESIDLVTARTASESASIDHGRSLAYDIAQHLRTGKPLPPAWGKLLQTSDSLLQLPEVHLEERRLGGCAAFAGGKLGTPVPSRCQQMPVVIQGTCCIEQQPDEKTVAPQALEGTRSLVGRISKHTCLEVLSRLIQPVLQLFTPLALLALAYYPSLLALSFIGTKIGTKWMLTLVPAAYLFSGLLLTGLTVACRWTVVGKTRDGSSCALWSFTSWRDTTWQAINVLLCQNFLELGKGSLLGCFYLQLLGATIGDAAGRVPYLDTLLALNPDLLTVGAGSAVGRNSLLFGHVYEGDKVEFKVNEIGESCYVGPRALVLPGLKMHDGAALGALALGMKGEVIAAY